MAPTSDRFRDAKTENRGVKRVRRGTRRDSPGVYFFVIQPLNDGDEE